MPIGYELDGPQSRFERSDEEKGLLNPERHRRPLLPCPARSHSRDWAAPPTSNWIIRPNTKIRATYVHWKGFWTKCTSKISVEQKVLFLLIHLGGGYIIYCRVRQGKYIIMIYVEVRQLQRERGNLSSHCIQLGTPFNTNADLRSAVHSAFALREFSKNNEVYGYISWPHRSPCLSDCDFLSWGYFKRRVFRARLANLTQSETKNFWRNTHSISYHIHVMWSDMNRVRQCVDLEGPYLTGAAFDGNFVVMFLNNDKHLSFNSH